MKQQLNTKYLKFFVVLLQIFYMLRYNNQKAKEKNLIFFAIIKLMI